MPVPVCLLFRNHNSCVMPFFPDKDIDFFPLFAIIYLTRQLEKMDAPHPFREILVNYENSRPTFSRGGTAIFYV